MDLLRKPYEISLWEDNLIVECWPRKSLKINGVLYTINSQSIPYEVAKKYCDSKNAKISTYFNVIQYYDEEKIAVIGSNTMDEPFQAFDPAIKRNVNGQNTLTFSIYYKYYNEETDQYELNPYTDLLVNERKVKLNYDDQWFDLIIKNAEENKEEHSIKFTATDALINELSKTGFNLEFDTTLNNNIGTIDYLADKILDGTEWELGKSDSFYERKDSVLYKIIISKDHNLIPLDPSEKTRSVHLGDVVYGFYNCTKDIINGNSTTLQVIYSPTDEYILDEDFHILEKSDNPEKYNAQQYYIKNVAASELNNFFRSLSNDYRAMQLIESTDCLYDPVKKKVVEQYLDSKKNIIYMYTSSDYNTSEIVKTMLTNGEKFVGQEEWYGPSGVTVERQILPSTKEIKIGKFHNLLKITGAKNTVKKSIVNTSVVDNFPHTEGFAVGQEYVFRISLSKLSGETFKDAHKSITSVTIRDYKFDEGKYKFSEDGYTGKTYVNLSPKNSEWYDSYKDQGRFVEFSGLQFESGVNYYTRKYDEVAKDYVYTKVSGTYDPTKQYYYEMIASPYYYTVASCSQSLSYSQMLSGMRINDKDETTYGWNIGLFIQLDSSSTPYYLESAQLFPYYKNLDGQMCLIGSVPEVSITTLYNYYYKPNELTDTENDIKLIYSGPNKQKYTPIQSTGMDKFKKTRTITGKESNRFNLLQSLCETFECWARFDVERSLNGKIKKEYIKDNAGINSQIRRCKSVKFLEYIGRTDRPGFVYGINVGNITRTLASDQIVTKLIVKQNNNEHAKNGFCSIARSEENDNRSSFVLNMNYYIRQNMLNYKEWNEDLYSEDDNSGSIGYYTKLANLMKNYQELVDKCVQASTVLTNTESEYKVYNDLVQSSTTAIEELKITCAAYVHTTLEETSWKKILKKLQSDTYKDDSKAESLVTQYFLYDQNISYFTPYSEELLRQVQKAEQKLIELKEDRDYKYKKIKELDAKFYRKYSHLIQEGSWIDENYIDDNLYYLDAIQVLNSSAFPSVNYSINVYEISEIEDFESYSYRVGDRTYVEDTEFFGYVPGPHGILTPYKEEIVVSETTDYLDSPEKNTITVQNYKTQFEDLFQRITATTQSLQYASGKYSKVSNIINNNGTIESSVLQKSIDGVDFTICNPKHQSIVWDSEGLSSIDTNNNMIRISTGAIKLSKDGGKTWGTAIDANGINTGQLTAGIINTEDIIICDGARPTFQWNKYGITAYGKEKLSYDFSGDMLQISYAQDGDFTYDDNTLSLGDGVDVTILDSAIYLDGLYSDPLRSFVRFDWNGIYGVPNGQFDSPATWTPSSMAELQENAAFGFVWNEFFLKSDSHGGMVKISSRNDIQVIGGENNERIKIGRLNNLDGDDALYGIRIRDNSGNAVMETGSDGKLWLKDMLSVGDIDTSDVKIGYNSIKTSATGAHEVINANDKFIVYEDGNIKATSGYIGNLTVDQISGIEENANEYTNEQIDAAIAGLKIYTDNKIVEYDNGLTQSVIFNRLMNNATDGALIKNGNILSLNANYLNIGKISIGGLSPLYIEAKDSDDIICGKWDASGLESINISTDLLKINDKELNIFITAAYNELNWDIKEYSDNSINATKNILMSVLSEDWQSYMGLYKYNYIVELPENFIAENVFVSCGDGVWTGSIDGEGVKINCFVNDNTVVLTDVPVQVYIIGKKQTI